MHTVSYVVWQMRRNGTPKIIKTLSTAHRCEGPAKCHYEEIISAMKAGGYSFTKGENGEKCVKGKLQNSGKNGDQTYFCVVFMS